MYARAVSRLLDAVLTAAWKAVRQYQNDSDDEQLNYRMTDLGEALRTYDQLRETVEGEEYSRYRGDR